MERVKKKKSHVGLIVLIVILVILIAPPAVLYVYLSSGCAAIEKTADIPMTSDPQVWYLEDGGVELDLYAGDLLPFAEQFDYETKLSETLDALPVQVELKCIVPRIEGDTLRVSVSAKAFGFLPLPLTADANFRCENGEGELTVTDVHIGKRIAVPMEKIPVDMPINFELDADDLMPRVKTVTVSDDKITIRQDFYAGYLDHFDAPYEPIAVEIAANTPGGAVTDPTIELFRMGERKPSSVTAYIASSADPATALRDVLALMRDTPRDRFLSSLKDYEKTYIFPYTEEDILLKRNAWLSDDCFRAAQNKYDTVLSDMMERYASLSFALDGKAFISTDANIVLSFEAEYPDSGLTDDDTKLCFMQSYAAWLGADTLGMPNIDDVPKAGKYKVKDPLAKSMYYTLCLMTRLPDGTPALIYHTAGGIFTECEIDERTYSQGMADQGYVLFETDQLQKPDTIYLREAKDTGLRDAYYFILPEL